MINRKLKERWDKKLRDSGFEDCEYYYKATGEPCDLKRKSHQYLKYETVQETQDYYSKALDYSRSDEFNNHSERRQNIWLMHCDGLTTANIAKSLGLSRQTIDRQLKIVRDKMLTWINLTELDDTVEMPTNVPVKDL